MTIFKNRLLSLTFAFIVVSVSNGFLPNRNSAILPDDFTREDLTKIGIARALSNADDEETDADMFTESYVEDQLEKWKEDRKQVERAMDEIVFHNAMVDVIYFDLPEWQFSNEKINEGNRLLNLLQERLLHKLALEKPNYQSARETLGQILHLVQMFYSNTNWVELNQGNSKICKSLGNKSALEIPVAPFTVKTCASCNLSQKRSCDSNLLTHDFLTSGYIPAFQSYSSITQVVSNSISDGDNDVRQRSGKCRHGSFKDGRMYASFTVSGGINKQSADETYSPHYFNHHTAAILALQHTQYLVTGLKNIIGETNFKKLFGIDEANQQLTIYAGSANQTEQFVKNIGHSSSGIYYSSTVDKACAEANTDLVLVFVSVVNDVTDEMSEDHGLPEVCNSVAVRFIQLLLIPSQDKGNREKRSLGGLDLYHAIADTSGGTVYETDKSNIAAVVDIIKESVSTTPPVTVLKFKLTTSGNNTFSVPIDDKIRNLTIKIQSSLSSVPRINLLKPGGFKELFSDPKQATSQSLGKKLLVIKLINPTPGMWKISRTSRVEFDVDVTAKTDLDFSYKLMQPGPGGFGEYPLIGRPIAGANTTVQVSVPLVEKVRSVDNILLLDRNGTAIFTLPLTNIGGRRGRALFKTSIVIPRREFKVAIEGLDKSGNLFRRLDPIIVATLAIKLEVLPVSGALYVGKSVTIPYRVTNVGGGTTTIVVAITDDQTFAQSPTKFTNTVGSQKSQNGSFVLKAGSTKGVTTTVTISAKASGAPVNKVQYYVQRITVEVKINKTVDITPPTCNITSTTGKCDFGTDVCECSKYKWSAMANVGDVGSGLYNVFASGAGTKAVFTNDTFSLGQTVDKGVVKTSLSADCCHQNAKITVVDLEGNVGICQVTITPGFVPPNPKLCLKPETLMASPSSRVTNNVTRISCTTTNISWSCDLKSPICNGSTCINNSSPDLCENRIWSMVALLGNESIGRVEVVPVNVGKHANLTKINNTLSLSTDCCHSSVIINVIDVTGNLGQCRAKIDVVKPDVLQSGNSPSFPIVTVAAGAGGGVVVLVGTTVLAIYLKKRLCRNNVMPMGND